MISVRIGENETFHIFFSFLFFLSPVTISFFLNIIKAKGLARLVFGEPNNDLGELYEDRQNEAQRYA